MQGEVEARERDLAALGQEMQAAQRRADEAAEVGAGSRAEVAAAAEEAKMAYDAKQAEVDALRLQLKTAADQVMI